MHKVDILLLKAREQYKSTDKADMIFTFLDSVEEGEHAGEWRLTANVWNNNPQKAFSDVNCNYESFHKTKEEALAINGEFIKAHMNPRCKNDPITFITDYGEME